MLNLKTNNLKERYANKMKVTIVGAGNVGTQLAVHCAEKGHEVTIYTSKPEMISEELIIVDENDQVIHSGCIKNATKDDAEAFQDSELIFITMPATLMKKNAVKIEPYANPNMKICLVPGTGGGECAFKTCIEKGATLFGVQRVPSVARLVEYGKITRAVGYRGEMFVAALPNRETESCRRLIEEILDIKTSSLPNYLNITLTPSNPILHTARLRNLYEDYSEGHVYERVPLFYEEWNDETSKLLLACDDEVQGLCRELKQFDLSYVKSLREHYESPTVEAMTKKITSIAGFKGLTSPTVKVAEGYIPDFNSRYFTADFSYGLTILLQVAKFVNYKAYNMEETLAWYYNLVGKRDEYSFEDYGIDTYKEFVRFYSK